MNIDDEVVSNLTSIREENEDLLTDDSPVVVGFVRENRNADRKHI
jgi:hypothetical protein